MRFRCTSPDGPNARRRNAMSACGLMALLLAATPMRAADAYPELVKYNFEQSRTPLANLEETIRQANPAQRAEIEARLIATLQAPDASFEGKQFVCRMLRRAGSRACVSAVAALLPDPKLSHMARFALEGMEDRAAGQALSDALGKVDGQLLIGVIGSVGRRGEPAAVPALVPFLTNSDQDVVRTTIRALGRYSTPVAVDALAAVKPADAAAKGWWTDARLSQAEALANQGKEQAAVAICEALRASDVGPHVKVAALQVLIQAKGDAAAPMVLAALRSDNPLERAVGSRFARELEGSNMTRAFVAQLADATPSAQVSLLGVLADRADRSALPAVLALLNAGQAEVRTAAVDAVRVLGDGSAVRPLANAAAKGDDVGKAAEAALCQLNGDGVDGAIVAALSQGEVSVRTVLVRAAAARRLRAALPQLLDLAAGGGDAGLQKAALKALTQTATAGDLAVLIDLVRKSPGAAQTQALATVRAVLANEANPAAYAAAVIKATGTEPGRAAITQLLSVVAGPEALTAARGLLNDRSPEVADAALRTLAAWPTDDALPDLLKLARSAANPGQRVIAFRGAVDLIENSRRPSAGKLTQLQEAMAIAPRADEKRLVVGALGKLPIADAIDALKPLIGQAEFRNEAAAAMLSVASLAAGSGDPRVRESLDMVVASDLAKPLKDRARQLIAELDKNKGVVRTWQLSQRFAVQGKTGDALLDTVLAPEKPGDTSTRWQVTQTGDGRVNLGQLIGGDNCAAYLRTQVYVPKAARLQLEIGSDDGVKVWVNGKVVHTNRTSRPLQPGEDKVAADFQAGWNTLLVKITQNGGDFGAHVRVAAPDGSAVPELRLRLE